MSVSCGIVLELFSCNAIHSNDSNPVPGSCFTVVESVEDSRLIAPVFCLLDNGIAFGTSIKDGKRVAMNTNIILNKNRINNVRNHMKAKARMRRMVDVTIQNS
eukprot:GDKJ01032006.1.p2 GENE.GDKJ01032006.1~~GDKJ01032006.1.p2  ORF type:complete len:103 (+),score=18.30 GDKJ01032006.1:404-712(+)